MDGQVSFLLFMNGISVLVVVTYFASRRHAETHEPMDLDKFFTYVAFDITGDVTFSKPFGFIEEGRDVGNAIAANFGVQIFLCTFGFYRWASYIVNNPLVTWTQLLPVGHIVNTSITSISERQKNPDAKFDMCSHWFRGVEKAKAENYTHFTDRHLLAAAVSNLAAGSGESMRKLTIAPSYGNRWG